jgi:GNAT superfamily N-acetyltransferase
MESSRRQARPLDGSAMNQRPLDNRFPADFDAPLERRNEIDLSIRRLDRDRDFEIAARIYDLGSDYISLEKGLPATHATVEEFFDGRPPTHSVDDKLCLGIFDETGTGIGVVDLLRGYPQPTDWYIGLLMFVPSVRGRGFGHRVVDRLVAIAKECGTQRLLVCALEDNVKGRAFWAREGFVHLRTIPHMMLGSCFHTRFEIVREI